MKGRVAIIIPMRTEERIETWLYALPVVIIVLGALLGLSLWAITSSDEPEARGTSYESRVETGGLPPVGNADAPVQIVMFGDYQCPFCTRFFEDAEQRIRAEFVAKGEVALWWRDFAVIGPASRQAARAARCANEQNAFWRYHDILFASRGGEAPQAVTDEFLLMIAEQSGLDKGVFSQCLSSDRHSAEVAADQQEGRSKGVQSVPTVFINGRKVVGAQPYAVFEAAILEALRR